MKITVFTRPDCRPCEAVKRKLNEKQISFTELKTETDESIVDLVKSMGYMTAPVIMVERDGQDPEHWGGFDPGRMKALIDEALGG